MLLQPEIEIGEPDRIVTERMRQFLQSRDPRVLWPALTASALTAARGAIERVVRAVLADERHVMLEAHGDREAYALSIAAFTSGTGALLACWMEDRRVQTPSAVQALFARQLDHGRRRAARVQRGVLPAFDALLARSITPIVIKGFHTALAYCEEPGVRPMSDVDIVVSPACIDDAEAALEAAGFLPTTRRVRPYKRDWMATNVDPRVFSVERTDARSRWQLELHESFDRDFPGGVDARLGSEGHHVVPFVVAGRTLLAPAQPLLSLVLACQISSELDSMRLMRLIDLVRVIRADRAHGKLDWDEVLAAFRRTGAARFAYPALALAEDLAPSTIDQRVLASARKACTWGIRHTVKRLVPGGGSMDRSNLIMMLMWAESPLGVVRSAMRVLARSMSRGRPGIIAWRALLRRIAAGAFSFGPPDEGQRETTPPRHQ